MSTIMYIIDFNPNWYTNEFYNGTSDIENYINMLLSYVIYIP